MYQLPPINQRQARNPYALGRKVGVAIRTLALSTSLSIVHLDERVIQ